MSDLAVSIRAEAPSDAEAVTRLHERTFGPGRFARSAFLLRERSPAVPTLSFSAFVGTLLVGSVRVSRVRVGGEPALLLGPLAVDPAFEGRGVGAALMNRTLAEAGSLGHGLVLLVGDPPYYARFGFAPVAPGQLAMPAPVDPARLLARELAPGSLARAKGRIGPE